MSALLSKVVERLQALPEDEQRKVLAYATSLQVQVVGRFPKGSALLHLAGSVSEDDASAMRDAVEEGFEHVDDNW